MEWRIGRFSIEVFKDINRELFLSEKNPLGSFFNETNCRFGSYLSKDFYAGRLKLDIKPLTIREKKTEIYTEKLALNFNFNLDLNEENKVDKILEFLGLWEEAHALAFEMASTIKRKCEVD